jgi:hypothetical protein
MTDLHADAYTPGDPPSAPPVASSAGIWEDFIDIFYTPASVFARRASSGFGWPMLVVSVLLGLIFLADRGVIAPAFDADFTRGMAAAAKKNPQLTPEQMEIGRTFTEKFLPVLVFIGTPITIFFVGLMVWLVGKLVDARQSFGASLMVASYAYIPKILGSIAVGILALVSSPETLNGMSRLTVGVAHFLDPDTASPALVAIAARVDVFTIWVTVLLVIGLSVTGQIPRSRAAVAGVIIWILGGLYPLLNVLRSQG